MKEFDFPTPDDIERDLAGERAEKLTSEVQRILDGGGSHESLELAQELAKEVASATRKVLTGRGGNQWISRKEMIAETDRLLAQDVNPFPNLTIEESRVYQYLQKSIHLSDSQYRRFMQLQRKAAGENVPYTR